MKFFMKENSQLWKILHSSKALINIRKLKETIHPLSSFSFALKNIAKSFCKIWVLGTLWFLAFFGCNARHNYVVVLPHSQCSELQWNGTNSWIFWVTYLKKRWVYSINPDFFWVSNQKKNPILRNHFSATLKITSKGAN